MACLKECIVTLIALVWLFSNVCFQMSPQTACLGRCIVTLVAFVQLFSTIVFSNEPSNRIFEKMLVTLQCTGCIHWICIHSLHCHTGCFCFTFSYYCRVLEICWGKKPKKIVQSINHLFQWNRVHVVLNLDDDIIFVQLTQCAHRGCNIVTDTFRRKKFS